MATRKSGKGPRPHRSEPEQHPLRVALTAGIQRHPGARRWPKAARAELADRLQLELLQAGITTPPADVRELYPQIDRGAKAMAAEHARERKVNRALGSCGALNGAAMEELGDNGSLDQLGDDLPPELVDELVQYHLDIKDEVAATSPTYFAYWEERGWIPASICDPPTKQDQRAVQAYARAAVEVARRRCGAEWTMLYETLRTRLDPERNQDGRGAPRQRSRTTKSLAEALQKVHVATEVLLARWKRPGSRGRLDL